MTLRPLAHADLDAAHRLWTRGVPLDPLSRDALADQLWQTPPEPDAPDLRLAATVGGALAGVGVGALWPGPGGLRGSVRLLAVAPERRRRGVGRALLDALAEALRQRGARTLHLLSAAPTYLTPGVDLRDAGALAFAAACGFRPSGEAVDLGVALDADDWRTDADEARLAAADLTVRRATERDAGALGALLDAHWPAWRPEAQRALDRRALHLALRGDEAVGFAAHGTAHPSLARFGPMGTATEARGLGVGAVLLRRCLADLAAAGHRHATISWAAALPFYERACGARVTRRYRRFERAL